MKKLNYIQGNIFDSPRKVIAHGVNCRGGFGSGVAGQIARKYPLARQAYLSKFNRDGWCLGEIQIVPVNGRVIANLATQDTYGKQGIHVNYNACSQAFRTLFRYVQMHQLDIAMPKIGAGLAGGDWHEIEVRLLQALENYEVEVDVYYLPLRQ